MYGIASMVSTPRQKMSPSDFTNTDLANLRIYNSLGSLIKAYRQWHKVKQETFAESIGIDVRELQRWEANRHCARVDNLHDLSEATGIPMQVVVALNVDQPIWYSLRKRRFAYSSIEKAQYVKFVSYDLCKYADTEEGIIIKHNQITTDKHISMVLSCHCDFHGKNRLLGKDVIEAASMILPELNRIAFDCWGHYIGHSICLPIKIDLYQQLKKQKEIGSNLTSKSMSDIVALNEGVFYIYSTFFANTSVAQSIIGNAYRYFNSGFIGQKINYLLAHLATTAEDKAIWKNMGWKNTGTKVVCNEETGHEHIKSEIVPTMYEQKLDAEMRRIKNLLSNSQRS